MRNAENGEIEIHHENDVLGTPPCHEGDIDNEPTRDELSSVV